jgi:ubiquitin carboxyl-terminal hydrolase 30
LPQNKTANLTLVDCINNYFKAEFIAEMKCENCHNSQKENEAQMTNATKRKGFIKRQAIAKLPDCLCIQIQRNCWSDQSFDMIKQQNYVQFPLRIRIDNQSQQHSHLGSSLLDSLKKKDHLAINNSQVSSPNADCGDEIFDKISRDFIAKNNEFFGEDNFSLRQVGIGGILGGDISKKWVSSVQPHSNRSSLEISKEKEMNRSLSHPTTNATSNLHYELSSAIVHLGNAHSGHFICYRKSLSKQNWLQISDTEIKPCKELNLLSSCVYMLFYDKVGS